MPKLILLILSYTLPLAAIAPFYKKSLEGFYYYCDPEEDQQQEETIDAAAHILTTFQQELTERLQKAVVFPTKKNIKNFLEIQDRAIKNTDKFATIWGQVILENALLSGQLSNPTDFYALKKRKQLEEEKIETLIREKKEDHVLLFFFDSTDPYSQIAAEMVKLFEEKSFWKVIGISLDGKPLPEFPTPHYTKDRGSSLKIQATPAYIILNPQTEQAIHVGYGAISVSRLEENIYNQLKEQP